MRVLLAGPFLPNPRQGSPKLLLRLGAEFERLGLDLDYLFLDALPRWAQPHRLSWFLFPLVVAAKVLWAVQRGGPYDVIDVSGGDGWLIAVLRRWFWRRGVLICRSHGWEHEDYRVRVRRGTDVAENGRSWRRGLLMRLVRLPMEAISAKYSDAIVVGSSPVLKFVVDQGWKGLDRVFVVPAGVDLHYFGTGSDSDRGRGLLFVGGWLSRKGTCYLARAYELLRDHGKDIPLSIIGFGQPATEVLSSFRKAVRSGVRIDDKLGALDEQDLVKEYRSHDILAFPSLYEGFGMVFLEAMACGLPVVATPVGGVVDIVRHDENGIIVPSRDSQALAGAVAELWEAPEKRRRLGKAARETARLYTWDKVALQTLQFYHEILARTTEVSS